MNNFAPLMRREWLQHRTGWILLALVPLGLVLLASIFGQVHIDGDAAPPPVEALPALLALGAMAGAAALVFTTLLITSLFIVGGLARRDHGDRSIEFWLSLPIGHAESLAVPLLVHLLLVPAAALLVGLGGGALLSIVLVSRFAGFGEWLALPWGELIPATLALTVRMLVGLPLSLLWLSPIILLVVLMNAWFKRWGLPMLAVGLGLGSVLLERVFGQPMLSAWVTQLGRHAARAFVSGAGPIQASDLGNGLQALGGVPAWAFTDLLRALQALASPLLAGALAVAALCFWLLVDWRRRGPSASV